MEHLNTIDLARLVDERPTPEESAHLDSCERCSRELDNFAGQTAALGSLPEIMPPKGDWQVLEAQLRSEGLVDDPGLFRRLGLAHTPPWMKAAAAVMLFLSGAGTGAAVVGQNAGPDSLAGTGIASVEEAATAVRTAEDDYVTAVSRYRELLAESGVDDGGGDPASRFAALEHLVMVSQAAVRQAPGDPFLNGFLASATAERDAALRMVSAGRDNWF